MRERVTFFHPEGTGVDPAALDIQDAGMLGPMTEATLEDRLTIPLDELPQNISDVLQDLDELHVHWGRPSTYDTLEPFCSRVSPGFHMSYNPLTASSHDPSRLCSMLQMLGQLDCMSGEAFTSLSGGVKSRAPGFQFYQGLEDIQTFIATATVDLCPDLDTLCRARVRSLYTIASLDIDYEAASKQLKLTAFWPFREQHVAVPASSARRTEVGILTRSNKPNLDPNHVAVAGVLTVLGESKKPSPTMFDFPSRHWLSEATFSAEFLAPTGLHPTLQLKISSNSQPVKDEDCAPYAYLTLPKTIFADRYQLADELFLASKNLAALRYTTLPVDLEAPAYTTKPWGSHVLLQLAPSSNVLDQPEPWTVEVPLHLRYLEPNPTGDVSVEIPYPAIFWACESGTSEGSPNPFDRSHLGYDDLFPLGTTFHHVSPRPENGTRLMSAVKVPVLRDDAASWIGPGTSAVIGLGFLWVLWKLLAAYMKSGYQASPVADFEDTRATGVNQKKN